MTEVAERNKKMIVYQGSNPRAHTVMLAFDNSPRGIQYQTRRISKAYQSERMIAAWAEYHAFWCGEEGPRHRAKALENGLRVEPCRVCGH